MSFSRIVAGLCLLVAISLSGAGAAQAGVYTFDFETTTTTTGGQLTSLELSQYGMLVSITRPGSTFDIIDLTAQGASPIFGARSLSPSVDTFGNPFVLNFSYPAIAVSGQMGDTIPDEDTITLSAYSGPNATGRFLGSVMVVLAENGGNVFAFTNLATTAAGIRSIVMIGGSVGATNSVYYDNLKVTVAAQPFDYDGDHKADLSVFRPATGTWYASLSDFLFIQSRQFGVSTDRIVPGDYDGEGRADFAVWRNGLWYIWQSLSNTLRVEQFGLAGDTPVPADYDADGKTDIAVWRPASGTWYIIESRNGLFRAERFGQSGDVPVPGEYGFDGKADIAVFRPSNGTWYDLSSLDGFFRARQFGQNGDKPVTADYDGDGVSDLAVFRAGVWYIIHSSNSAVIIRQWGAATDIPVPADYDDVYNKFDWPDAKASIAVFRPSNGVWYRLSTQTPDVIAEQWGSSGDVPVPAAYPAN